jgi:aminoglycoside/choline kinase family phosphotransferase
MSRLWTQLQADGAAAGLSLPWPVEDAVELHEHASTRSFYRLVGKEEGAPASGILVLYPDSDDHEVERYLKTAEWMRRAGVPVPRILAVGTRAILVEDGGDRLLAEAQLSDRERRDCYVRAAEIIGSIQRYGRRIEPPNGSWALDEARLAFEMEFFEEHTLQGWLGVDSGATERKTHYERLVAAICELPVVACHRDYHARNLIVGEDDLLVLDFQDVMWGPQLYDLASLVWDNYCAVPEPIQEASLLRYWQVMGTGELSASRAAAIPDIPRGLPAAARQAFCLVALQRHLKALGTFGYQITRAGRVGYERYMAATWEHVRRAAVALQWEDFLTRLSAFDRRVRGGLLE